MPAAPTAPTMLVIDDEPQIRRVVRRALEADNARVLEAASGREGLDLAAAERPDLIVLDLGLPDMPGADVCRDIRGWSAVPIVVLSARHSDTEKAALLDLGADDYVTKPFSTPELVARVQAQLRRSQLYQTDSPGVIRIGDLSIDLARRTAARNGRDVGLTPVEWHLLRVLATNAGRTLTHRQLFHAVWGNVFGDAQQNLRVHITHLRRKIETTPAAPSIIVTEPGVGYRCEIADPS